MMKNTESKMALLTVIYNPVEYTFAVVNTFDGVVVGRFYTRADAEDFAFSEEANEAHRIHVEYPDT